MFPQQGTTNGAAVYQALESEAMGLCRNAIVRIHAASRKIYGRPRIHAALREEGTRISPKRVHRLMKSANITGVSPRRFKKTTDSNHRLPIAIVSRPVVYERVALVA